MCSLRGDIRELAANPFSEHMQTFLFAFHSHRRWDVCMKEGMETVFSPSIVSLSARQTKQTGWLEALQMYISHVKR